MALQPPLRVGSPTEPPPEVAARQSSASVYSAKRNNFTNNDTTTGMGCCGGGHHGCGCGCAGCMCRLMHFKDDSNREAYGGEGGRQGMPGPDVDLPDHASRFASSSSSVRSNNSHFSSNGSFSSSFEVHGPLRGHHAANLHINGIGYQFANSEEEEDGHYAWHNFTSPVTNVGPLSVEEQEDSSGMVIPGVMDDSTLAARGSTVDLDERSILNSEYESSFNQPSTSARQVLTGAGAAFEPHLLIRPLRLTPECRHSITNPIRVCCAH